MADYVYEPIKVKDALEKLNQMPMDGELFFVTPFANEPIVDIYPCGTTGHIVMVPYTKVDTIPQESWK